MEAAEILTAAGLTAAAVGGRNRLVAALAGAALVASSAFTRFGIFYAGRASASDPKYTIGPQRARISPSPRTEPGAAPRRVPDNGPDVAAPHGEHVSAGR